MAAELLPKQSITVKSAEENRTYPADAGTLAKELLRLYPNAFTTDFEENKALTQKMMITQSKSLRNQVTGHITRIKIREASGQVMTVPVVSSDRRRRRGRRGTRRR